MSITHLIQCYKCVKNDANNLIYTEMEKSKYKIKILTLKSKVNNYRKKLNVVNKILLLLSKVKIILVLIHENTLQIKI